MLAGRYTQTELIKKLNCFSFGASCMNIRTKIYAFTLLGVSFWCQGIWMSMQQVDDQHTVFSFIGNERIATIKSENQPPMVFSTYSVLIESLNEQTIPTATLAVMDGLFQKLFDCEMPEKNRNDYVELMRKIVANAKALINQEIQFINKAIENEATDIVIKDKLQKNLNDLHDQGLIVKDVTASPAVARLYVNIAQLLEGTVQGFISHMPARLEEEVATYLGDLAQEQRIEEGKRNNPRPHVPRRIPLEKSGIRPKGEVLPQVPNSTIPPRGSTTAINTPPSSAPPVPLPSPSAPSLAQETNKQHSSSWINWQKWYDFKKTYIAPITTKPWFNRKNATLGLGIGAAGLGTYLYYKYYSK
jgi:hypothetical protein